MPRFTSIPTVPTTNIGDWNGQILNALKENVELLTGTRGESDLASRALTGDRVKVKTVENPTFARVTAQAKGYTISGVNVAALDDYSKLIIDVQNLGNDVLILRASLNALINQLKG
jgi:hypothetical protein